MSYSICSRRDECRDWRIGVYRPRRIYDHSMTIAYNVAPVRTDYNFYNCDFPLCVILLLLVFPKRGVMAMATTGLVPIIVGSIIPNQSHAVLDLF